MRISKIDYVIEKSNLSSINARPLTCKFVPHYYAYNNVTIIHKIRD